LVGDADKIKVAAAVLDSTEANWPEGALFRRYWIKKDVQNIV
jgi:hypothetical protein